MNFHHFYLEIELMAMEQSLEENTYTLPVDSYKAATEIQDFVASFS